MAVRVKPLGGESGQVDTAKAMHTLRYDAWDTASRWPNFDTLMTAVLATAPTTYRGLDLSDVSYDEDDDGSGHWIFACKYDSREPAESLLRMSFDTTGGTVRMSTSRATQSYPLSGRTAPDFKGAINVQGGNAQGTDVVVPTLKLTYTYKWPKGVINQAAIKNLSRATGSTNVNEWQTYQPGELLFLGASGELDFTTPTEIQYHFAAAENESGLSLGEIAGITKAGHDYLWVYFESLADSSAQKLVERPLAAYVERLYRQTNFNAFGIG